MQHPRQQTLPTLFFSQAVIRVTDACITENEGVKDKVTLSLCVNE
jgi:hypothetical protein